MEWGHVSMAIYTSHTIIHSYICSVVGNTPDTEVNNREREFFLPIVKVIFKTNKWIKINWNETDIENKMIKKNNTHLPAHPSIS